jgi:hypothetical protein
MPEFKTKGLKPLDINNLSPHLFWDVDKDSINADENKQFIVRRVLEYGLLSDWVLIYHHYGLDEITSITLQIKDLDAKSLSFISALSKKPKEEFRCFTTKQSTPQHWNF